MSASASSAPGVVDTTTPLPTTGSSSATTSSAPSNSSASFLPPVSTTDTSTTTTTTSPIDTTTTSTTTTSSTTTSSTTTSTTSTTSTSDTSTTTTAPTNTTTTSTTSTSTSAPLTTLTTSSTSTGSTTSLGYSPAAPPMAGARRCTSVVGLVVYGLILVAILTSDGHTFTTIVSVTTVVQPGTAVTPTSVSDTSSGSKSNTGAIVGGVVGGVGGLALLVLIVWFFLRRQRNAKDDFDGNFDPARVGGTGGGGTLPQIDVDEDDGVGGRLATGAEGGGIISPYSYTPSALPQMSQASNMPLVGGAAAAAAGAGAGSAGSYYNNSGSASYYPGTSSEGAPGSPVLSAGRSSEGGYYPASANPYGAGPPLSTVSGSEHSSGGYGAGGGVAGAGAAGALGLAGAAHAHNRRSAKEMEALGARVTNPDEARAAYLQYGPGGAQSVGPGQYYPAQGEGGSGANGSGNGNGYVPDALRPGLGSVGSGVVVHQDGGRVLGKGRAPAVEEGAEDQLPEIPPTYDSLLPDRGEGRQ
ncbi:hypothetical protein HYPSUDRAFT_52453 [Hypholoma sublateritium FD-334 SS-4]|uniref:REJ domain-containing protein n=1 Tax=Hypholoma sublateritium (strain FD-334 SS-4) TaxID=945553 RepID=A0A0D2PDD1_HYPSF|nr:hypothetical protein HYPSUDRAFT_52453 [Hypholoma sublateritium FD-334 SS-4]